MSSDLFESCIENFGENDENKSSKKSMSTLVPGLVFTLVGLELIAIS